MSTDHASTDRAIYPVDNFGTVVGENPDCLLLSGTVVSENPDHVCWVWPFWPSLGGPEAFLGGFGRHFGPVMMYDLCFQYLKKVFES